MALAGLHNVSAFCPSLFVEGQAPRPRNWGERLAGSSSQPTSILQMRREIKDDEVTSPRRQSQQSSNVDVSEDTDETVNQGLTMGAEMIAEDNESFVSEQSSDMGELRRERVRQISREWMNSGSEGQSNEQLRANNHSGPPCHREHVHDGVRIVREWVQVNAQLRNNSASFRNEDAEADSQVNQVRERIVNSQSEIGARRPMRRLCGRQTLLDLLLRAQSERNVELQRLGAQRRVSDFAHRNRIQVLLRGRFLRNELLTLDKRQSSTAATELGMLGKRVTVSDIREGFLSKLHDSASTSMNSSEPNSSMSDKNNAGPESSCVEREVTENYGLLDSEFAVTENSSSQVTEAQESVVDHETSVQEVSMAAEIIHTMEEPTLAREETRHEVFVNVETIDMGHVEQNNVTHIMDSSPRTVDRGYDELPEVLHEDYDARSGVGHAHELGVYISEIERGSNEESRGQDSQVQDIQESVTDIDVSSWNQTSIALLEWTESVTEDMARNWQENSANHWFQEISNGGVVHQETVQESQGDWPHHSLQAAIDSWLDIPSREIGSYVGRTDSFYFPEHDNGQDMELRELVNRRHVSSLLGSSFRDSLDQVLQSHVERLGGDASGDWEVNSSSSPNLAEQDVEQLISDHTLAPSDGVEINSLNSEHPLATHMASLQPLWDDELQGSNWPHGSSDLHLGTDWEFINELRVDVSRLQLRMNNLQSMLEACMELQIELQRSVRQEVSAALNHSVLSRRDSSITVQYSESQWNFVREGICCLCCENKIDSLLYRCGHMCTCLKCAEVVVQNLGKCPMCQAPIVEVVRAYLTH